jgi:hypothetical protein
MMVFQHELALSQVTMHSKSAGQRRVSSLQAVPPHAM